MRRAERNGKRPGFTLVELLIVIIIIGILAGGMMLVAGGGTDKANATKIVSDLRNLKSAALMYYADKSTWPTGIADLTKYVDREISAGEYDYNTVSGDRDIVGYKGSLIKGTSGSGVREKLEDTAKESGLYELDGSTSYGGSTESVWMRVR